MNPQNEAWRSWPLSRREQEYSPSSCVPALAPFLAAYKMRSHQAEQLCHVQKDLRWGNGPKETLDFFPAARSGAPLLLFIHGGYWQELSKNDSLFAAPDCIANGIAYAALEYILAPRADLATIVEQCRRAVRWLHEHATTLGFDRRRLYVAGSSAGAHLAAMLLVSDGQKTMGLHEQMIAGVILLSGIYDIEPLIGTYIDTPLRLTLRDVETLSPQRLPLGKPVPGIIAWGEHETQEFKRQSKRYAAHLRAADYRILDFEVPGTNHFDIVFSLADRSTSLGRATIELIQLGEIG